MANYQYDANGNVTNDGVRTYGWDAENRLESVNGAKRYSYDPENLRVYDNGEYHFYAPDGRRLGRYVIVNGAWQTQEAYAYFNGRLIAAGIPAATTSPTGVALYGVFTDRVGSVRVGRGGAMHYYPYGQERTATANGRDKFGTYRRDALTGLDYARQRYYQSHVGRFLSADPYLPSGGPANTNSWNRYAYVEGDPVNWSDPSGLEKIQNVCEIYPDSPSCSPYPSCSIYPDSPRCKSRPIAQAIPECTRPRGPVGASIDRNIEWLQALTKTYLDRAMTVSPEEQPIAAMAALTIVHVVWIDKVRPGGDWDYKRRGNVFQEFGNFNYGATAAALQIPYYVSQNAAGIVNIASNITTMAERILRNFATNDDTPLPDWWISGVPLLRYPFGDDDRDARDSAAGYAFYGMKMRGECR